MEVVKEITSLNFEQEYTSILKTLEEASFLGKNGYLF